MGLKNSKRKYTINREIIPTYTQYRAKKTRSASKIVEENGGQQITVTVSCYVFPHFVNVVQTLSVGISVKVPAT